VNQFLTDIDADVTNVFLNAEEFGTKATWTDSSGNATEVNCIFGQPYVPLEVGDPIQSDNPRAIVHSADLANCRQGDGFDVEGIAHEILEAHPCGTGATVLILSRDPAPRPKP